MPSSRQISVTFRQPPDAVQADESSGARASQHFRSRRSKASRWKPHNLHALRAGLDVSQVIRLAKQLNRARRIIVVGVDFAASL